MIDLDTQQTQSLAITDPLTHFALSRDAAFVAAVFRPATNVLKLCLFSPKDWQGHCNAFPNLGQFVWGR